MMQTFIHYGGHFLVPLLIAYLGFRSNWKFTYLLLISTMLIDLDHLLATPIFDAARCSISYHPLHGKFAAGVYLGAALLGNGVFRILGIGLFYHLFTDFIDCLFMVGSKCSNCSDIELFDFLSWLNLI